MVCTVAPKVGMKGLSISDPLPLKSTANNTYRNVILKHLMSCNRCVTITNIDCFVNIQASPPV